MRLPLFVKDGDYLAFERVLAESLARPDAPDLLAWCLMPNHWHLVVEATRASNLSTWMQWVTVTHAHRWHTHTGSVGQGPLYQGRFKSVPVQQDSHFLTLCRYVEANALRAGLVHRAEDWRWGSLWVRRNRSGVLNRWQRPWPVPPPSTWLADVNMRLDGRALEPIRTALARGIPLGSENWSAATAARLGLELTLRPRGRPRKKEKVSG